MNVAGAVALKGLGVATATPGIAFAFAGPFAKLLLTAEFFGSGFNRESPITAFLSLDKKGTFYF